MTIIVGVESTVKPYSAVIAADTMAVDGYSKHFLTESIGLIGTDSAERDDMLLSELEKGVLIRTSHKIQISPSRDSVLGFAGTHEQDDILFEEVKQFLFEGVGYLQRKYGSSVDPLKGETNRLIDMLTDFAYHRSETQEPTGFLMDREILQKMLQQYTKNFSLVERLLSGFIPEIPRITAVKGRLDVVYGTNPSDNHLFHHPWNINGAYLFSTTVEAPVNVDITANQDGQVIEERCLVFPIMPWGSCRRTRPFTAIGSGSKHAIKYLKNELDLVGDREYSKKETAGLEISTDRAVQLATGAVRAACENNIHCDGLDYVILNKDGVEEYFSEEKTEAAFDMQSAIKATISDFEQQLKQLKLVHNMLTERAKKRDST